MYPYKINIQLIKYAKQLWRENDYMLKHLNTDSPTFWSDLAKIRNNYRKIDVLIKIVKQERD